MAMAWSFSRRRTLGTVFGSRAKSVFTLFSVLLAACTTISCVTASPAGEVGKLSVSEVQEGVVANSMPLRWGGTIAKVHNKTDITVLEIVSRPLLRSGRPRHNDSTDGRFLAEINGFLDPEIVKPGRDISVVGLVGRIDDGQVGDADYRYPVMSVFDYRFWKKTSEIDPNSGFPPYFVHDRIWRNWPYRSREGLRGTVFFSTK